MSNKRTASDGLKFATHLWHTERDPKYALSVLDDLLRDHPDSSEAEAASRLLEEINNSGILFKSNDGDQLGGAVNKIVSTGQWLSLFVVGVMGIVLISVGSEMMDGAGAPGAAILGLIALPVIAFGGVLVIWVLITGIIRARRRIRQEGQEVIGAETPARGDVESEAGHQPMSRKPGPLRLIAWLVGALLLYSIFGSPLLSVLGFR